MAAIGSASLRFGGFKDLLPPPRVTWWRNCGRRLGVLQSPGAEEPVSYFEPGHVFAVARVVTAPGGRRYLQLVNGGGWVPERSRKDSAKVVAVHIADPGTQDAGGGEPASAAGEGPAKRRRTDAEAAAAALPTSPSPAASVRHLRVTVLATRTHTTTSMSVGEVGLRCRGETLSMEGFKVESPNGHSPVNEGPDRLLQTAGKFLDFNFRTHGQSVFVLTAPEVFEVEEIAFRTANDSPPRDPMHVIIDGSRDGREWTQLLDSGAEMPLPLERRVWTPWFGLQEQGPAKAQATPAASGGVKRFYCLAKPCCSYRASVEGYVVEGKVLTHMLRDHPRSPKTHELALKLHGTGATDVKTRDHRSKKVSVKGEVKEEVKEEQPTLPGAARTATGSSAGNTRDRSKRSASVASSSSSSSSSSSDEEAEASPQQPAPGAPATAAGGSPPETPRKVAGGGGAQLTPSPLAARQGGLSQPLRSALRGSSAAHAAEVVEALNSEPCDDILEALAGMSPLPSPDSGSAGASDVVPIAELDSLRRYPPLEGTVMQRWQAREGGGFSVRVRDPSGAVDVAFLGKAAEAFREEPALREGSCVRLEGYDIVPARAQEGPAGASGRRYELLMGSVHAGVSAGAPDCEAETGGQELTPLQEIEGVALGSSVNIEAVVHFVGRLVRRGEPPQGKRPAGGLGPSSVLRPLVLRQGPASCSLVLTGDRAEGHGAELRGRRVIVHGSRVIEFRGKRHLSGWRRVEFASGD